MENLNFNIFNSEFANAKGNIKLNSNDSALANRPLSSLDMANVNNKNIDKNTKPIASDDLYKSGNIPINSKYKESENHLLPVTIKPGKNNDYVVLENDLSNIDDIMGYEKSDKLITNRPIPVSNNDKNKKKESNEMNISTQFYVGSLTVIGLFIFYRLIQKTR
jgi:hypothetical protein